MAKKRVTKKGYSKVIKGKKVHIPSHSQIYNTGKSHKLSKDRTPISGSKKFLKVQKTFWRKGHPKNPAWFSGRFNSEKTPPKSKWRVKGFSKSGDDTGIIRENKGRIVGRT